MPLICKHLKSFHRLPLSSTRLNLIVFHCPCHLAKFKVIFHPAGEPAHGAVVGTQEADCFKGPFVAVQLDCLRFLCHHRN